MAREEARVSVLADRVAKGQADPISDEEQQIADGMGVFYAEKFGGGSKTGLFGRRIRPLHVILTIRDSR